VPDYVQHHYVKGESAGGGLVGLPITPLKPEPDENALVFTRVDPYTGKGHEGQRELTEEPLCVYTHIAESVRTPKTPSITGEGTLTRSSLLILVLVLVPLVVGAAAVVIVSCNYYCNLC
jgi:hypothetical protein